MWLGDETGSYWVEDAIPMATAGDETGSYTGPVVNGAVLQPNSTSTNADGSITWFFPTPAGYGGAPTAPTLSTLTAAEWATEAARQQANDEGALAGLLPYAAVLGIAYAGGLFAESLGSTAGVAGSAAEAAPLSKMYLTDAATGAAIDTATVSTTTGVSNMDFFTQYNLGLGDAGAVDSAVIENFGSTAELWSPNLYAYTGAEAAPSLSLNDIFGSVNRAISGVSSALRAFSTPSSVTPRTNVTGAAGRLNLGMLALLGIGAFLVLRG